MLERESEAVVLAAVQRWAERHANPDGPLLELAQGRSFSPRQIADELARGESSVVWRLFDFALRTHSVEEVVASFRASHDNETGPARAVSS